MSWNYLNSHSSPEQAAEFLEDTFLDGDVLEQLKSSLTQDGFYSPASGTGCSQDSQSGTTSKPSEATTNSAEITSTSCDQSNTGSLSAGDGLAKTSALRERAQELQDIEAGYGRKWRASFARFDPQTYSWRTHQYSLFGGLSEFSGTWPRWGMMRNGECWERTTAAPCTYENEFGFLPTPNCSMDRSPCPRDAMAAVMEGIRDNGAKITLRLQDYVAAFGPIPTPTRSMHKGATIVPRKNGKPRAGDQMDYWVMAHFGGKSSSLSPLFAEWVMWWPVNWTATEAQDSKPSETAKSQSALQRRLESFREWHESWNQ